MTDVHTEHCCLTHGCKYGNPECTVTTGRAAQSFPCERCGEDAEAAGVDATLRGGVIEAPPVATPNERRHVVRLAALDHVAANVAESRKQLVDANPTWTVMNVDAAMHLVRESEMKVNEARAEMIQAIEAYAAAQQNGAIAVLHLDRAMKNERQNERQPLGTVVVEPPNPERLCRVVLSRPERWNGKALNPRTFDLVSLRWVFGEFRFNAFEPYISADVYIDGIVRYHASRTADDGKAWVVTETK